MDGRCVCPPGTAGASCTPVLDGGAVRCDAPSTFYRDRDADGFGDGADITTACELPDGYAGVAGDCAPDDDARHPMRAEICDGVDQDCDGSTDEVAPFDATRSEVCDGIDQDCDGRSDEGLPVVPGAAVSVSESSATSLVALVPVASGYGAVWVEASGRELVARLLGEDGAPSGDLVTLGPSATDAQAEAVSGDTIVVTWRVPSMSGYDLRARIVRLADSLAGPAITVVSNSGSWLAAVAGESHIVFAYVYGSEVRARAYTLNLESPSAERSIYGGSKFVRMQRVGLGAVVGGDPYFVLGVVGNAVEQSFLDRVAYDPLAPQGAPVRVDSAPEYVRRVVLASTDERVDAMLASGGIELVRLTPGEFSSPLMPSRGIVIERAPANLSADTVDLASSEDGTDLVYVVNDGGEAAVAHRFVDRAGGASARAVFGHAGAVNGVAVARRSLRRGAVLYDASDEVDSTTGSVVFRRIGCE